MKASWLCTLLLLPVLAQAQARVENVRVFQRGDTLVVRYALANPSAADSVYLRVSTRVGVFAQQPRALAGDVGRVRSVNSEKVIFWNMKRDGLVLDEDIQVEVLVKTFIPEQTQRGGPEYALLSAVAPGIGNIFVQPRKPNGRFRVGLRPVVTIAFYGLLGYGIWQKVESNRSYESYRNSLRESVAKPHYEAANSAHQRYYLATRVAAVIWAADVTATLLRGLKNQHQTRRTSIAVSPGFVGTPTVLSFHHQF